MANGKPGRPRKSASVIKLHGNRGKLSKKEIEAREASEVQVRPLATTPPADLSPLELECWRAHAPELERLGLLTVLDPVSFRLTVCQPYEMIFAARESMRPTKADGSPDARHRHTLQVVVTDDNHGGVLRRHPGVLIWRQALDAYRSGCGQFGLTPAARVGLRPGAALGGGTVPDDDDDEFFGT